MAITAELEPLRRIVERTTESRSRAPVRVGDVVVYYDGRIPLASSLAIVRKKHDGDTLTLQLVTMHELASEGGHLRLRSGARPRGDIFSNVKRRSRSEDRAWSVVE